MVKTAKTITPYTKMAEVLPPYQKWPKFDFHAKKVQHLTPTFQKWLQHHTQYVFHCHNKKAFSRPPDTKTMAPTYKKCIFQTSTHYICIPKNMTFSRSTHTKYSTQTKKCHFWNPHILKNWYFWHHPHTIRAFYRSPHTSVFAPQTKWPKFPTPTFITKITKTLTPHTKMANIWS